MDLQTMKTVATTNKVEAAYLTYNMHTMGFNSHSTIFYGIAWMVRDTNLVVLLNNNNNNNNNTQHRTTREHRYPPTTLRTKTGRTS